MALTVLSLSQSRLVHHSDCDQHKGFRAETVQFCIFDEAPTQRKLCGSVCVCGRGCQCVCVCACVWVVVCAPVSMSSAFLACWVAIWLTNYAAATSQYKETTTTASALLTQLKPDSSVSIRVCACVCECVWCSYSVWSDPPPPPPLTASQSTSLVC